MNEPTDWITTHEASELSGYAKAHISYLIRQGGLVGQKFGRDWQVSKASLLAYMTKMENLGKKRGPKTLSES